MAARPVQPQGEESQRETERDMQRRRPEPGLGPQRLQQVDRRAHLRPGGWQPQVSQQPAQQHSDQRGERQRDQDHDAEGDPVAERSDHEYFHKARRADRSQPVERLAQKA
jgi:hypothetical protein